MTWTTFTPAWFTTEQLDQMRLAGGALAVPDRCYRNSLYQVSVWDRHPELPDGSGFPRMLWLSIKRLDRQPIHDWRHLQRIKDEIVGPRHEAVELYPARGRLVDTANQYHLFVLADPDMRFPFGWREGLLGTPAEAAAVGAVQRPMEAP